MAVNSFHYPGKELEIFANAITWKKHFSSIIKNYTKGHVLEVGAGIGSNTPYLFVKECPRWVCLEPDRTLATALQSNLHSFGFTQCKPFTGTIEHLDQDATFDTVIYIDVLEHIKEDKQEVSKALDKLKKHGHLIILCPAHQWLYTAFDKSIGHYRRYTKAMLKELLPSSIETIRLEYLDCAGLLASLGNKLLLKQGLPTAKQIYFWDRFLVPVSKIFDPLLCHKLGKSVLLICRK